MDLQRTSTPTISLMSDDEEIFANSTQQDVEIYEEKKWTRGHLRVILFSSIIQTRFNDVVKWFCLRILIYLVIINKYKFACK